MEDKMEETVEEIVEETEECCQCNNRYKIEINFITGISKTYYNVAKVDIEDGVVLLRRTASDTKICQMVPLSQVRELDMEFDELGYKAETCDE